MGSTTLPPGAQTTVSGHVVSVASDSVVIDGSSYAWAAGPPSPTSTTLAGGGNLGGLILSAFGTGYDCELDRVACGVHGRRGEITVALKTRTAHVDDGHVYHVFIYNVDIQASVFCTYY